MRKIALLCFVILLAHLATNVWAASSPQPQDIEQQKIHYLLDKVASSDAIFIRNGQEYKGADAKAHLERKLKYAGSRIHTAEDFIAYVADKSSFTGKPYMVKKPDDTQVTANAWLHEQLKNWPTKKPIE